MEHKPNLQNVKRIMERCKFFTGLNKQICDKGVLYTSFHNIHKLPCLSEGSKCSLAIYPSMEEALIEEREWQRRFDLITSGYCPFCNTKLEDRSIPTGICRGRGGLHCPKCDDMVVRHLYSLTFTRR